MAFVALNTTGSEQTVAVYENAERSFKYHSGPIDRLFPMGRPGR